jgi:hypothetical protein
MQSVAMPRRMHSWPNSTKPWCEFPSSPTGGTRQYVLRHFPFVVYRTSERMTQIVAIAHARRRPGYWKNRDNS